MNRFLCLLLAGVVLALPFDASAKNVNPRHLKASQPQTVHVLAEDFVFVEKAATFTLRAGTYTQVYEDRRHVYLLGTGHCLEMRVVPPKNPAAAYTMGFDCGIQLPKDPTQGAAFFTIVHANRAEGMGPVVNALIAYGNGSFNFPSRQMHAALTGMVTRVGADPAH